MEQLRKDGFDDKDLVNLKKDADKLKDLEFLKAQTIPGPFTSKEEVDEFLEREKDEILMNQRLYIEVRYAKATCQSMTNPSKFIKLKRNGNNFASEEYASCLKQDFDTSRNMTKLTMPDLHHVIGGVQGVVFGQTPENIVIPSDNQLGQTAEKGKPIDVGEHLAVFWIEESNNYVWYLAVVDSVVLDGICVSHLVSTDRKKQNWVFPEEADVHKVEHAQILSRNLRVAYHHHSIRIRCSLCHETIEEIEKQLLLSTG